MANYGPNSIVIAFDDSGGTPQTMTQYVREINGVKISAILTESQSFGDTWFEALAVGISRMDDIVMRGFYDDTASTGPNALFIAIGNTTTRTWKITYGSTKTTTVETIIVSYERIVKLQELTMYEVVLRPTGAVTEA